MNEVKPISDYSSAILLSETMSLVKTEREITLQLIEHLREIEKRFLFAELGFGSLFEFTTKYLGLSEGSAHRRIASMRLVRDIPEVKEKLKDGSLSLSNAAKIQVALKTVSKNTVSKNSAADAQVKPNKNSSMPTSKEPQPNETGSTQEQEEAQKLKSTIIDQCLNLSQKKCEEKLFEMIPALTSNKSFSESQKRVSLDLIELKLIITKELHEKIIHLNHQLSHSNPELAVTVLLERLVNQELKNQEKKKPHKQNPAAGQNEMKKSDIKTDADKLDTKKSSGPSKTKTEFTKNLKAIPAATVRLIFSRANHRCEIEGCQSTYQLQIDHIIPRTLGGSNDESNLRLICRVHNLLAAKKIFGPNQMKSFVMSMRD